MAAVVAPRGGHVASGGIQLRRATSVVTHAKRSKSAIPRAEPEADVPTPLTEEQLSSLPPEMLEKDIWAGDETFFKMRCA